MEKRIKSVKFAINVIDTQVMVSRNFKYINSIFLHTLQHLDKFDNFLVKNKTLKTTYLKNYISSFFYIFDKEFEILT